MSNLPPYAADAIWRLALALPVNDRDAFEAAALAKIGELTPSALGPGSVDRAIRPIWRSFFHPPEVEPCYEENSPPRFDRRRSRTTPTRPKLIKFRGETFYSRAKLAEALSSMCALREPSAIANALRKFNDDGEAVIAHYQGKPKPRGANLAPPAS